MPFPFFYFFSMISLIVIGSAFWSRLYEIEKPAPFEAGFSLKLQLILHVEPQYVAYHLCWQIQ
jgi:hypothetical protein